MTVTVATPAEQKRFGGKLRIKSSWYRQQSVAAACNTRQPADRRADPAPAYYRWLAAAHLWLSPTIRCPSCHGTGREPLESWRTSRYRRTYKRCTGRDYDGQCRRCDGAGRVANVIDCPACYGRPPRVPGAGAGLVAYCTRCGGTGEIFALAPDVGRAAAHVEAQRRELDYRARRGVAVARWWLLVRGADALTYQAYRGYLHIWESTEPCGPGDIGAGYWRAVRRPSYTAARKDLFRLPDGRVVYLGIEPRRGARHDTPHDLALVIEPGRAPSEAEACAMVDELIGEPAEQPLPLAA